MHTKLEFHNFALLWSQMGQNATVHTRLICRLHRQVIIFILCIYCAISIAHFTYLYFICVWWINLMGLILFIPFYLGTGATSLEAIMQAVEMNTAQFQNQFQNLREELKIQEIRRMRNALNCWRTNNRTMVESAEFKHSVINYYERAVNVDSTGIIITARCMVSNEVFCYNELTPAHLVKHSTPHLMRCLWFATKWYWQPSQRSSHFKSYRGKFWPPWCLLSIQ